MHLTHHETVGKRTMRLSLHYSELATAGTQGQNTVWGTGPPGMPASWEEDQDHQRIVDLGFISGNYEALSNQRIAAASCYSDSSCMHTTCIAEADKTLVSRVSCGAIAGSGTMSERMIQSSGSARQRIRHPVLNVASFQRGHVSTDL